MIVHLVGLATAAFVQPTAAQQAPAGSPERAAADFVAAFIMADEPRFDAAWSEEATVFWPNSDKGSGRRIEGKAAVLAAFHEMFAARRAERPNPPYFSISPLDLRVQRFGDTALVSFHLGAKGGVNRRTLLLRREGRTWRIVHLHASLAPVEGAAPTGN